MLGWLVAGLVGVLVGKYRVLVDTSPPYMPLPPGAGKFTNKVMAAAAEGAAKVNFGDVSTTHTATTKESARGGVQTRKRLAPRTQRCNIGTAFYLM